MEPNTIVFGNSGTAFIGLVELVIRIGNRIRGMATKKSSETNLNVQNAINLNIFEVRFPNLNGCEYPQ